MSEILAMPRIAYGMVTLAEDLPQFNEFTVDNFGPKIIPPRCKKSYLSMYIEG